MSINDDSEVDGADYEGSVTTMKIMMVEIKTMT